MDQRVRRIKVLKTFLLAAVPLAKLDTFHGLLEESALQLTDRRHMSDLIPFVYSQEQSDIKTEICDRPISMIFDHGTTRLGEALAMLSGLLMILCNTATIAIASQKYVWRRDCPRAD